MIFIINNPCLKRGDFQFIHSILSITFNRSEEWAFYSVSCLLLHLNWCINWSSKHCQNWTLVKPKFFNVPNYQESSWDCQIVKMSSVKVIENIVNIERENSQTSGQVFCLILFVIHIFNYFLKGRSSRRGTLRVTSN